MILALSFSLEFFMIEPGSGPSNQMYEDPLLVQEAHRDNLSPSMPSHYAIRVL